MVVSNSLEDLCNELKRRCYERGAEDNLTVIVVRVGEHLKAGKRLADLEPTITPETEPVYTVQSSNGSEAANTFVPASRIAFPAPASEAAAVRGEPLNVAAPAEANGGNGMARLLGVLVVLLLIGGAFYAGARYKERIPFLATKAQTAPVAAPTSTPIPEEPFVKFERARRAVDQDPRAWLANDVGKELLASSIQNPLDSQNAEFLYLYGRANLLTGNIDEAGKAFDAAITKSDASPSPANATIKKEAILGLAVISVRTQTQRDRWKVLNHYEELTKPPANSAAP
jgi:tetratricopeptide (TPR) repeat protein